MTQARARGAVPAGLDGAIAVDLSRLARDPAIEQRKLAARERLRLSARAACATLSWDEIVAVVATCPLDEVQPASRPHARSASPAGTPSDAGGRDT